MAHPSPDLYGSDRVLLESVAGLVDAGWRVVVTVPADGPLVPELEARGAQVRRAPTLVLRKALLRPLGWPALLAGLVRGGGAGLRLLRSVRPDVVYVNTVTIPLWLVLARLARVPAVCHVHEAERSASGPVRRALALPVLLARSVLVNSRFSADVLCRAAPGLASRSAVVLNGVPGPPRLVPSRADVGDGLRVLYLGRLSPRKGVDVAVEALALLRERPGSGAATLDLVGAVFPGYEWYQEQLAELVAERGLAGAVRVRGFLDPVWPALEAADVVVVPSRLDEPFGNTAVEAVLAGRPVVASATSGLLEATAGYTCATTVPPDDAPALADALADVVTRWADLRAAAEREAPVAARRHDPAAYRAAVAAAVEAVVRR